MNNVLVIGLISAIIIPILFIMLFVIIHRKSYKYKAIIVREVGDSYVIENDKFRVRQRDNKMWVIDFLKKVRDSTPSMRGDKWSNFFVHKKKTAYRMYELNDKQMKNAFRQGAIFYQASEQELKPIVIDKPATLTVLNQDNRSFIIEQIRKKEEFRKEPSNKWVQIAINVGVPFVIMLSMVIMWIVFNNHMTENVSFICSQAKASAESAGASGLADSIRGVIGG